MPGSHWEMEEWFRGDSNLSDVLERGSKALPRAPQQWSAPLQRPHQVKMRAGDLMVAHYSLAHSIAPNTGGTIRYMVYFRLCSPSHLLAVRGAESRYRPEAIKDLWLDWPAMRHHCAAEPAAAAARQRQRWELRCVWDEMASLWPVSRELMEVGQHADAARIFHRLATLWPEDYELRITAAATSMAVPGGGVSAAASVECLAHAETAAQLCPALQAGRFLVLKSLFQMGNIQEAIEYAEREIIEVRPTVPYHRLLY